MASAQLSAKGLSVYSDNILSLLGDTGESDVKLVCRGEIFQSFKCFLTISSAKFAEIFDTDRNIERLEITDVSPDILELMLQYIYAAKIDDWDMTNAPALYDAAANYGIFNLRRLCGSYIIKNVTEQTVCKVLVLASRHPDDRRLMDAVRTFVLNNTEFLDSVVWRTFTRHYKPVATKFLDDINHS